MRQPETLHFGPQRHARNSEAFSGSTDATLMPYQGLYNALALGRDARAV